jgi:phage shock protein A
MRRGRRASKRTLALAIAGDQQEGRRLDATNARIADLELRATAALDGGREDLAREAAQRSPISRPTATPR